MARFAFALNAQEQERLRWYLEDYLQYPFDPAPQIASRVEGEMEAVGTRLFRAVFMANRDTEKLWFAIADCLDDLRLEIAPDVTGAGRLPWELLFDPDTRTWLALHAQTFVRTHATPVRFPDIPQTAERLRILLVICRPSGRRDVPFCSVASRIIKGLSKDARQLFDLDVLRPPTFEQLEEVLRAAKRTGQPYHVVHFEFAEVTVEELLELRTYIEQGRYAEALVLIGEMEEMSRDDKINKIESFLQILLLHLIKQQAEQRTTRSWDVSIKNAVDGIQRTNKRRRAGGFYLDEGELQASIEEIFPSALRQASLEAFEGRYNDVELAARFDQEQVKQQALQMALEAQAY
jgi:hypothetical protein